MAIGDELLSIPCVGDARYGISQLGRPPFFFPSFKLSRTLNLVPPPLYLPSLLPAVRMSNPRAICRPHAAISSFIYCCRGNARLGFTSSSRKASFRIPSPSAVSSPFVLDDLPRMAPASRANPRRTLTRVSNWNSEKSPYETLELERDADEEKIKAAYRRLAKSYHPDVYDGRGTLEEGETAESRFIKIQAAYELLIDEEKRRQYDRDHRVNPMKASQAWMEWLMKKRKAFDQRGDMAVAAWAEQQQREMNIRARRLSRSKSTYELSAANNTHMMSFRNLLLCEKSITSSIWSFSLTQVTRIPISFWLPKSFLAFIRVLLFSKVEQSSKFRLVDELPR